MLDGLSNDEWARLVYLVLLGGILTTYALVALRGQIATGLRHFLLWGLLFLGTMAGYGLWESMSPRLMGVQTEVAGGGAIEVRRARDGHFHLTLEITGPAGGAPVPIRTILDTGATELVLTRGDAARLGFGDDDLAFTGTARTANGITRTAPVRLERVRLGNSQLTDVRALVNQGQLHVSLLGMGYLSRFSRIEIAGDRLRIEF